MSPSSFQTWLKDSQGISFNGQVLEVSIPNIFVREWLEKRLHSLVGDTVAALIGQEIEIRFTFASQTPPCPQNRRYSFEQLVTGDFNRLAFTSAQEVLSSPGGRYNPLVLWGDTGVGKTHLLQGMDMVACQRGWRSLYLTAEHFTTQFISALRHQQPEAFRHTFQSLDLCLLDDFQFLQGKGQTLQVFFHIFNDLYESDCQWVLASNQSPRSLNGVEERLRSRLMGGLLIKVESPTEKDRQLLIATLAQKANLMLPAEINHFLAEHTPGNIRELEGIVNRLLSLSKGGSLPISPELAMNALGHAPAAPIPPAKIVQSVLDYFQLPPDALKSRRRLPNLAQARLISIYLLREQGYPLSQIGELVGGLAKSSVLAAYRKSKQSLAQNEPFNQLLSNLRNRNSLLI